MQVLAGREGFEPFPSRNHTVSVKILNMADKYKQLTPEEFARKNKKNIVNEYFRKYPYEVSDNPSGIFMAGLPGAGKTEFVKRLLGGITPLPVHIDMDEIASSIEGYKPQFAHLFKGGANIILERVLDHSINKKINFILDGTFGHDKAISNVERSLVPKHGFKVRIYYIFQDPIIAWKNTVAREKIEQRKIDADGFIETYFRLRENIEYIFNNLQSQVPITVVMKNKDLTDGKVLVNPASIKEFTRSKLTKKELLDKINAC